MMSHDAVRMRTEETSIHLPAQDSRATVHIERFDAASRLPAGWDALAPSYFQQHEFLEYAERFNPCKQRYYAISENGEIRAGAIVYTLRLDLLTFVGLPSPVGMNIIGVPIGTATPGYFGNLLHRQELLLHLTRCERGILLTLNADPADELPTGTKCRMVPTILFENRFRSWSDYVAAMRALHRRRLQKIDSRSTKVNRVISDCSCFTADHYRLYRAVHDRASAKLENLSLDFFRHLPSRFVLASYYQGTRLVSWTITVHDGTMFMYFFGGMDYARLKASGSYFIGLANIVRDCIEQRHPLLDLGQTADEPKMRFGGRQAPKNMYLTHHTVLVRKLFQVFRPVIEYHGRPRSFDVFREDRVSP